MVFPERTSDWKIPFFFKREPVFKLLVCLPLFLGYNDLRKLQKSKETFTRSIKEGGLSLGRSEDVEGARSHGISGVHSTLYVRVEWTPDRAFWLPPHAPRFLLTDSHSHHGSCLGGWELAKALQRVCDKGGFPGSRVRSWKAFLRDRCLLPRMGFLLSLYSPWFQGHKKFF